MAVFDIFSVDRELDLLEFRLRTLNEVVDRFVIVEGTRTYTGKPKRLWVSEHLDRFAPWADKLDVLVVSLPAEAPNAWAREHAQNRRKRDFITDYTTAADHILLGDVDELPRPAAVRDVCRPGRTEPIRLEMTHAEIFANWVRPVRWRASG